MCLDRINGDYHLIELGALEVLGVMFHILHQFLCCQKTHILGLCKASMVSTLIVEVAFFMNLIELYHNFCHLTIHISTFAQCQHVSEFSTNSLEMFLSVKLYFLKLKACWASLINNL